MASPGGPPTDELALLAKCLLSEPTDRNLWRQQLSLTRVLDWLEEFPADTWQDRWLLSGSDDQGSTWGATGPERRNALAIHHGPGHPDRPSGGSALLRVAVR
ncbi:hypothetical protein [Streptomyces sp. SA15]|uniref:hypothetical protein n=1 Tax=Streptomyces sp. SA15 TaxID=934019 RepID=UPI0015C834DE|nr:hypothetical protein [Streptomyces sp. SA15]